jgi:hypothetical protein
MMQDVADVPILIKAYYRVLAVILGFRLLIKCEELGLTLG